MVTKTYWSGNPNDLKSKYTVENQQYVLNKLAEMKAIFTLIERKYFRGKPGMYKGKVPKKTMDHIIYAGSMINTLDRLLYNDEKKQLGKATSWTKVMSDAGLGLIKDMCKDIFKIKKLTYMHSASDYYSIYRELLEYEKTY